MYPERGVGVSGGVLLDQNPIYIYTTEYICTVLYCTYPRPSPGQGFVSSSN